MNTAKHSRLRRITVFLLLLVMAAVLFVPFSVDCFAEGTLLSDSSYELIFTEYMQRKGAVIQSVCATEYYIYSIENTVDDAYTPDIVRKYYKNDVDEFGNPVLKYSLAMSDANNVWEHGNGMCYNPNTKKIYVAPYTNCIPEDRGCLLIMNPDTLQPEGRIKITDSFNILSVEYDRHNDIYYIQANAENNYSVYVLDCNFNIIQELGPTNTSPGYNLQAFGLAGDYLLQSPLTLSVSQNSYINAYNRYTNELADCVLINMELQGAEDVEPEQIYRLDDESFIIVVNKGTHSDSGCGYFYRAVFPNLPIPDTMFDENTPETVEEAAVQEITGENALTENMQNVQESAVSQNSEVKISRKVSDLFEKSVARKNEKKGKAAVIAALIAVAAAAIFGWYANVVRIRRARRRREARLRKLRKQARQRALQEYSDLDDTDTGKYDKY